MPEPHPDPELDQRGLLGSLASTTSDPEPLGRAPQQTHVAGRLGRCHQQQALCLARKRTDALHKAFLDPAAGKLFTEWTFDAYAKAIGDEFGKTVMGFRGDEPAYGFNPWTPRLFDEFEKRKGYDAQPFFSAR